MSRTSTSPGKRILSVLMALVLAVGLMPLPAYAQDDIAAASIDDTILTAQAADVWDGTVATAFASGSGTEGDPYVITTGAQLAHLASVVNSAQKDSAIYAKLGADIDLNNKAWTPIGDSSHRFEGTFDGQGHTISNMTVSGSGYIGLFGNVDKATLQSFEVVNAIVTSTGDYAGGVVAYARGYDGANTLWKVGFQGTITSSGKGVGGLVGWVYEYSKGLTITECYAKGQASSSASNGYVGGLVGNYNGSGSNYAKANTITSCYSLMTVKESQYGGGMWGYGWSWGTNKQIACKNSYVAGSVSGGSYAGFFAGGYLSYDPFSSGYSPAYTSADTNYYLTESTGSTTSPFYGGVTSTYVSGKPSAEMKTLYSDILSSNDTYKAAWQDGSSINTATGYPALAWETVPVASETHSITVSVSGNTGGTAQASVESAAKGASVTVTATPSEGYQLSGATTDNEDTTIAITGNIGTFTMPDKDISITVTFAKLPATPTKPTIAVTGANDAAQVIKGSEVSLTASSSIDGEGILSYQWYSKKIRLCRLLLQRIRIRLLYWALPHRTA